VSKSIQYQHIVIMGVAGSGKSTLAATLAQSLNARYADADDFHPEASVEKMRRGEPLTDEDRLPWLSRINGMLRIAIEEGETVVLACSALKNRYRSIISSDLTRVQWVLLDGDIGTIAARMRKRTDTTNHYMPESLLHSQFATLERPNDAIVIDIALPTESQLRCVLASLSDAQVNPG
jgi:gluconokinase